MKLLRTPDSRFNGLPDYAFAPRYTEIGGSGDTQIRIHAIDEGPREAAPVLLMHGEPSWGYLYRHIVPALVARGHRVVVPDLVGFGRSDKPAEQADYTYEGHVGWMTAWLGRMGLRRITLFCQDWGGLIGLRLVAAAPDLFDRVIAANTALPIGTGWSEGFRSWLEFSQGVPQFPAGGILKGGSVRELSPGEIAAYDAPFPDESYKSGARVFPRLVPITPEHASVDENKAAWRSLEKFEKPFLTAFSDKDAVTQGGEAIFQQRVPGARNQPHRIIRNAGHFLQEDAPAELAELIDAFTRS